MSELQPVTVQKIRTIGNNLMKREDVFNYIEKVYGASPEYLWKSYPTYAVFRNKDNQKWFCAIMNVAGNKVGLDTQEQVDIMNVKLDPDLICHLKTQDGYAPAWHMNKEQWLTVLLDGSVQETKVLDYIDWSYELIEKKTKK